MNNKTFSNKFTKNELQRAKKSLEQSGFYHKKNYLKSKYTKSFLDLTKKIYSKYKNRKVPLAYKRDSTDKIIYNLQTFNHNFIKLFNENLIKQLMIYGLNDPHYNKINNNKPNYTLKGLNARSSGEKLDLHIDTHFPFTGKKTFMFQVAIPLEVSNSETGCTIVVKKSHLSGKYTNRKSKKISKIIAEPGDLIIWDSRIWHGALNNKSKKSRWQLIATFGCWWIKPQFQLTTNLPKKIFNKCNNEEKTILGFFSITPKNEFERISTKTGYNN